MAQNLFKMALLKLSTSSSKEEPVTTDSLESFVPLLVLSTVVALPISCQITKTSFSIETL